MECKRSLEEPYFLVETTMYFLSVHTVALLTSSVVSKQNDVLTFVVVRTNLPLALLSYGANATAAR